MQITSVIAGCKLVIRYLLHCYIICAGQIKYYQELIPVIMRVCHTTRTSHREN